MPKVDLDNMDNMYFDVLKELGNIGAGNATTSLSQMLQIKVDMKVPKVELLSFHEVGEAMGGEELVMAGIYLLVEGDITGSMMFLLQKKSAGVLVSHLMGMPVSDEENFSEMEMSALKEIGNIITGSYLNALSSLTNLKIFPSIPDLCIDMAGAILSVPAIEFGIMGDKILLIETAFTDDSELNGYFILIPDLQSYDKILGALGM
ncbi:chemotaxis protein CheC [bacterium 1XD42-8]|jgi:chemotaxis protein CheC|nr:chemotaxis protein CheC [Lachnospiraceae bacterium]RKJ47420.1 chemotaxis protein CheC [bacterium 1XD42-8]